MTSAKAKTSGGQSSRSSPAGRWVTASQAEATVASATRTDSVGPPVRASVSDCGTASFWIHRSGHGVQDVRVYPRLLSFHHQSRPGLDVGALRKLAIRLGADQYSAHRCLSLEPRPYVYRVADH